MKVRAKQQGFYANSIRELGSVFEIKDKQDFSPKWMEKVQASEEREQTSSKKKGASS